MLGAQKIIAFVATSDAIRAKAFYGDTLGLHFVSEEPYALVFDAGGTMLRVALVQKVATVPYTVLGWRVPDIGAVADSLKRSGIEPERFDGMEQDASGIWTSPGGAKVVWFKDPDGNTLSATQC